MSENAYIEEFLENLRHRKYSPKSINTYRYPLRLFFEYLSKNSSSLRIQDVSTETLIKYRRYLLKKEFLPSSIEVYLRALRIFFRYLEEKAVIFANPMEHIKNPRGEKKLPEVPSINDLEKLISVIDLSTPSGMRDRAMVEVAYCCGLRLNEILSLSLFNVDLQGKTLRVLGKGKQERMLPLGKQAYLWLKKYLEYRSVLLKNNISENHLWINSEGRKVRAVSYQKTLQNHAKKANLEGKITGHSLRRACATHMLQNGANPVQIQMLLGHATLKHLSQYLKLTITEIKAMHERSKLGK